MTLKVCSWFALFTLLQIRGLNPDRLKVLTLDILGYIIDEKTQLVAYLICLFFLTLTYIYP